MMTFKTLLIALFCLFVVTYAEAALVFDAASSVATNCNSDATCTGTHTPVGTPTALMCFVVVDGTLATNTVAQFTYDTGGTPITLASSQVALSPNDADGNEDSVIHIYFLGSGVPSGAKNWAVDVNGTTVKFVGCVTWTGTGTIDVIDTTVVESASQANPSGTLTLGGRSSTAFLVYYSGLPDSSTGITALTDWTKRLGDATIGDFGASSSGVITYNNTTSSDITFGYTAAADDVNILAVAIAEPAAGGTTPQGTRTGVLP